MSQPSSTLHLSSKRVGVLALWIETNKKSRQTRRRKVNNHKRIKVGKKSFTSARDSSSSQKCQTREKPTRTEINRERELRTNNNSCVQEQQYVPRFLVMLCWLFPFLIYFLFIVESRRLSELKLCWYFSLRWKVSLVYCSIQ